MVAKDMPMQMVARQAAGTSLGQSLNFFQNTHTSQENSSVCPSQSLSQHKMKFDLSKQINEINKKKLAKEKTFSYD